MFEKRIEIIDKLKYLKNTYENQLEYIKSILNLFSFNLQEQTIKQLEIEKYALEKQIQAIDKSIGKAVACFDGFQ